MRFEFTWALTELGHPVDRFAINEAITSGDLTCRHQALAALTDLDKSKSVKDLLCNLRLY